MHTSLINNYTMIINKFLKKLLGKIIKFNKLLAVSSKKINRSLIVEEKNNAYMLQ